MIINRFYCKFQLCQTYLLLNHHFTCTTIVNTKYFSTISRKIYIQVYWHQQKVNTWAAILDNSIIGPCLIDRNLSMHTYLNLFQNSISSLCSRAEYHFDKIWFQQDGCLVHNAIKTTILLKNTCLESIISRSNTIL